MPPEISFYTQAMKTGTTPHQPTVPPHGDADNHAHAPPHTAAVVMHPLLWMMLLMYTHIFSQQIALQPEVYTAFRLQEKEVLSHDTRMFRFALQSPKHVLGLPIGQHVSMKFVDEADGKMVTRSYTPTSSDLNVREGGMKWAYGYGHGHGHGWVLVAEFCQFLFRIGCSMGVRV